MMSELSLVERNSSDTRMKPMIVGMMIAVHLIQVSQTPPFSLNLEPLIEYFSHLLLFGFCIYLSLSIQHHKRIPPIIFTLLLIFPIFLLNSSSNYLRAIGDNFLLFGVIPLILLTIDNDRNVREYTWEWGLIVSAIMFVVMSIFFILVVPFIPAATNDPFDTLRLLFGAEEARVMYQGVANVASILWLVIMTRTVLKMNIQFSKPDATPVT